MENWVTYIKLISLHGRCIGHERDEPNESNEQKQSFQVEMQMVLWCHFHMKIFRDWIGLLSMVVCLTDGWMKVVERCEWLYMGGWKGLWAISLSAC